MVGVISCILSGILLNFKLFLECSDRVTALIRVDMVDALHMLIVSEVYCRFNLARLNYSGRHARKTCWAGKPEPAEFLFQGQKGGEKHIYVNSESVEKMQILIIELRAIKSSSAWLFFKQLFEKGEKMFSKLKVLKEHIVHSIISIKRRGAKHMPPLFLD